MGYVTVSKENNEPIQIYFKDWGKGQPIVFSHGWPLSADAWDDQMFFYLLKDFVVLHMIEGGMDVLAKPGPVMTWIPMRMT
jgi:hypothetical protein